VEPTFSRAKFIGEPAPDHKIPDDPMDPADARLLIDQELCSTAIPRRTSEDLDDACKTLKEKGGVHPSERRRVHTATGY
jgi:glutamate decarboxylase